MPFIEIEKIWTDDDGMVQLELCASNDMQVGKQDFYFYPEGVSEFGARLQEFPKTQKDEISLEYGADPKFYCYFSLKALVLDSVGHSALEVKFDNRLDPPSQAQAHFFMKCEPATVNEFGKRLCAWVSEMNGVFRYDWKNA